MGQRGHINRQGIPWAIGLVVLTVYVWIMSPDAVLSAVATLVFALAAVYKLLVKPEDLADPPEEKTPPHPWKTVDPDAVRKSKVAGISRRQEVVYFLSAGTVLEFVREPENPADPNAIMIMAGHRHVGYVNAALAAKLAPGIDAGDRYGAWVTAITGGEREYGYLGVNFAYGLIPEAHAEG